MVNQRGLFTLSLFQEPLEDWIQENEIEFDTPILIKYNIKNSEGDRIRNNLDKMNINHLSLYPDLEGVSLHCNNWLATYG